MATISAGFSPSSRKLSKQASNDNKNENACQLRAGGSGPC